MTIPQALQLAVQHHQSGRLADAEKLYRQILAVEPRHPDALHLLGLLAHQVGRHDLAADLIRQAIAINPAAPQYLANLGNVQSALGQLDEAVASYQSYLEAHPDDASALSNLGATLRTSGQFDEAAAALRKALKLQPNLPQAHNNLGLVLRQQGRLDEAAESYRQAIALQPNYPEAQSNLGIVLKEQGLLEEAIAYMRRALEGGHWAPALHSNLILTLHLHPDTTSATIAEELRQWNDRYDAPFKSSIQPHLNDRTPDRRLRIGYVSPDFREHVLGTNIRPLFAHHDPSQFEIFCYSGVVQPDHLTEEFRRYSQHWRNTVGLSDEAMAGLIRRDAIDILVDLSQHMAGNRLTVFARQPAPVQVSFAGYPGPTGLEAIQHRITGRLLEPNASAAPTEITEHVHLIDTFWCYDPCGATAPVNELPATKNGFVTFGCLHHFGKITERMLGVWARLLNKAPNSHLIILAPTGSAHTRTLDAFAREGVSTDRIEFVNTRPRQSYLELYHHLDIVLDTFPYNGHTTILDALWMGVPVVTLAGEMPVSRAGLSSLTLLGHPERVARSDDAYVQIAAGLTLDLTRLVELRATLRPRLEASPLMNATSFTREIEDAYREMWRAWATQ